MGKELVNPFGDFEARLYALAKVGKSEYLKKLQNGKIRFTPLFSYKRKDAEGKAHYDGREGLVSVFQLDETNQLTLGVEGQPPHTFSAAGGFLGGTITISNNVPILVFSLFAFYSVKGIDDPYNREAVADLQLTDEIKTFGDSIWIITSVRKFQERLLNAFKQHKLPFGYALVPYVDTKKFDGEIPKEYVGFAKVGEFQKQQEYRYSIYLPEPLPEEYILDVGDLSDISDVRPVAEGVEFKVVKPEI